MAAAEHPFLLDTGAWTAVRRRRAYERAALWGSLLGALALTAVAIWGGLTLYRMLTHASTGPAKPEQTAVVPAPPVGKTPILVWNGLGEAGVAAEAARQLMMEKYPIVNVGNAPDSSYMHTYVMYSQKDPAGPSAAKALIKRMKLDGAIAQPMDGLRRDQLEGARLLVIVAEPLANH